MNDALQTRGNSNTGSALIGFTVGAVIGAGIALLLAPESGKKTRQRLASTAQRWSRSAGHTFDQARDTLAGLGTDAKSAIKAGQDSFVHDRATRESRSGGGMSQGDGAPGLNAGQRPSETAAR